MQKHISYHYLRVFICMAQSDCHIAKSSKIIYFDV